MHTDATHYDLDELANTEPLQPETNAVNLLWACVAIGFVIFAIALFRYPYDLLWASFYTNCLFWMGLACGSVMISVVLQIVRATWATPVRRLAEANVAYLPWAYFLLLSTWWGRTYLFPWAKSPMPGREWWMQPAFVYVRFALMFGLLFLLFNRFVRMSLRSDIGFIRERTKNRRRWLGWEYDSLTRGWTSSATEVDAIQNKLSWNAPLLVVLYCIIYSLFAFEMVMGMDTIWYSNMFGGFNFIGNIYVGFAGTAILAVYWNSKSPAYRKNLNSQALWDMGKLTFAFCMLWTYLFISQFLPQWYGNLPEETQWLILRTRELPWKPVSYLVLGCEFILPFILLVSEDLKKVPGLLATVCGIIFFGNWLEKYVVVMPQVSPESVPFGIVDVGLFLGFLGIYGLSIAGFLKKYPFIPLSHPQTQGRTDW